MDKLQEWLRRIQRPPRREVANIDYWALLTETRIAQEAGMPAESAFQSQPWEQHMNDFRRSPSYSAGPRDPASRRSANR